MPAACFSARMEPQQEAALNWPNRYRAEHARVDAELTAAHLTAGPVFGLLKLHRCRRIVGGLGPEQVQFLEPVNHGRPAW